MLVYLPADGFQYSMRGKEGIKLFPVAVLEKPPYRPTAVPDPTAVNIKEPRPCLACGTHDVNLVTGYGVEDIKIFPVANSATFQRANLSRHR
jgi:hypothetical protein